MKSPPHTRSRTRREDVVEVEPPHSVASRQTVQQPSPAAAEPTATPSTPVARKRQRAEPAEPRIVKFVVGKFRPSDLRDVKNAKKRLAKPQTQEDLQHKKIIYLPRRLKAYKDARNEVWKVARGFLRVPVERRWTQPHESLVAKMKGQVEDSPTVEEIWDEWSSPFAELERKWDDIHLTEFPEVTAAPRWGTPSWTSFPTAFSRQFIARPSARVREVRGWMEIPEYEPEIQPDPNPVRFLFSTLQALGGLIAPRARHDEEDSDEVVEARAALPTPASSGVSAELGGSAALSPLPAARVPGSARAAPRLALRSSAAPPPEGPIGQGPLPPLSPTTTAAANALVGRYMSRTVAAARAVLTSLPHGQSSVAGLVGRMRQEQLGDPAVTEDQGECLVGFWLSRAERLPAFMGPGRTSLREFLNGVYRAGQVLLGTTVATTVPSRLVAAPAAPLEPSTSTPLAGPDHPSALPGTPEETTPPPPLPDLRAKEFRMPESSVAAPAR
ncbi:hypothetical protein Emag_000303 [Eimeria magna]